MTLLFPVIDPTNRFFLGTHAQLVTFKCFTKFRMGRGVSRPFRSLEEFLLVNGVTRCISWSDSHEVTTFLTFDNVYILVCTDCFVLSAVYILGCTDWFVSSNKRQFTSGFAPYIK